MQTALLLLASIAALPASPTRTPADPQAASANELPLLELTRDDTRVTRSVRVRIAPGLVLADERGDGVVQVAADGIRLVFEPGSVLRGAADPVAPDQFQGFGVRLDGHSGVTIEGLEARGYKAGLFATHADGLRVVGAELSDNFAQRLHSTPEVCDDGADWLACHDNDAKEWLSNYGASIYIADSSRVSVVDCRARRTQNGLLLDRVSDSDVLGNDFSFLSGWGLGLWRSSNNRIAHNAFDFCIRGYSHGVYNRGQDSAGILVFEQCSGNLFVDNSATHGGDGVFGFAGSEALGQRAADGAAFDATRLGNNDNDFRGNDFSYAAAHGLEMTFSFGNLVRHNRFAGNAICGIWGGYSQGMLIHDNLFEDNGAAGYGLERGGVNIEHSVDNWIVSNVFERNACGVHLWWDPDEGLLSTPWARANKTSCEGNGIANNRFSADTVAVQLRSCQPVVLLGNEMLGVETELDAPEGSTREGEVPSLHPVERRLPPFEGLSPVGARRQLAGRENIVMGEWGPWDHESPFLQRVDVGAGRHVFALHQFAPDVEPSVEGQGVSLERLAPVAGQPRRLAVQSAEAGFHPYVLRVGSEVRRGLLERLSWRVACFPTPKDPRVDEPAWQAAAAAAEPVLRDSLKLGYAMGGPADVGLELPEPVGRDHFGTLALSSLPLPAGRYELKTRSDDGIRVYVDGERVIDNWTWHAPTEDVAVIEVEQAHEVHLRIEHFELDGYALLEFSLAPLR